MPGKGRPFKKGRSGNPGGRPKIDQALREIELMGKEQYREVLQLIVMGTHEQLVEMMAKPGASALTECIISCVLKIKESGDVRSLDILLDRLIGKVPTENHQTKDVHLVAEQMQQLKRLPTSELKKLAEELILEAEWEEPQT